MPQQIPFEAEDLSGLTIKNTFIDLDKPTMASLPRSSSLPADMSSLEALEGSEKAQTEQHQDSDVATDAGVSDVLESEADNSNSSSASQIAASQTTMSTPLSSKARPWQPQPWEFDPLQCMPPQQQIPFAQVCNPYFLQGDPLPFEFAEDTVKIVMNITRALQKKSSVVKVDTVTAADGGWDVFVRVDDLSAGQRLLDQTMDSLIKKAEASQCTYVLGCEDKPFYISAGGLCFTAYFAAIRDEEYACRSMYDLGFCHGGCNRAHPPCMLRLSVTVLDDSTFAGKEEKV